MLYSDTAYNSQILRMHAAVSVPSGAPPTEPENLWGRRIPGGLKFGSGAFGFGRAFPESPAVNPLWPSNFPETPQKLGVGGTDMSGGIVVDPPGANNLPLAVTVGVPAISVAADRPNPSNLNLHVSFALIWSAKADDDGEFRYFGRCGLCIPATLTVPYTIDFIQHWTDSGGHAQQTPWSHAGSFTVPAGAYGTYEFTFTTNNVMAQDSVGMAIPVLPGEHFELTDASTA